MSARSEKFSAEDNAMGPIKGLKFEEDEAKYSFKNEEPEELNDPVEQTYAHIEERAALTADILAARSLIAELEANLKAQKKIGKFFDMLSEILGPKYRSAAYVQFWAMKHILPVLKGPHYVRSNKAELYSSDIMTALRESNQSSAMTLLHKLRECADDKDVARLGAQVRAQVRRKTEGRLEEAKEDTNSREDADE